MISWCLCWFDSNSQPVKWRRDSLRRINRDYTLLKLNSACYSIGYSNCCNSGGLSRFLSDCTVYVTIYLLHIAILFYLSSVHSFWSGLCLTNQQRNNQLHRFYLSVLQKILAVVLFGVSFLHFLWARCKIDIHSRVHRPSAIFSSSEAEKKLDPSIYPSYFFSLHCIAFTCWYRPWLPW